MKISYSVIQEISPLTSWVFTSWVLQRSYSNVSWNKHFSLFTICLLPKFLNNIFSVFVAELWTTSFFGILANLWFTGWFYRFFWVSAKFCLTLFPSFLNPTYNLLSVIFCHSVTFSSSTNWLFDLFSFQRLMYWLKNWTKHLHYSDFLFSLLHGVLKVECWLPRYIVSTLDLEERKSCETFWTKWNNPSFVVGELFIDSLLFKIKFSESGLLF